MRNAELSASSFPASDSKPPALCAIADDSLEAYWNSDLAPASVRIDVDAASHQRRRIVANALTAAFHGMHREEFLARAASFDVPFPYPEPDALAMLLYLSVAGRFRGCAPVDEIFVRIYMARGGPRRPG